MNEVTAEQVQKAVNDRGIFSYSPRSCSLCSAPLRYLFSRAGNAVAFDSRCGCGGDSQPNPRSFVDVANHFNLQTPEIRAAIWADFLKMGTRTPPAPLTFGYANHRGKYAVRTVEPLKVWFGSTEWHPEPQWFLQAIDIEKNAARDFALKDFSAALVFDLDAMIDTINDELTEASVDYPAGREAGPRITIEDEGMRAALLEALKPHRAANVSAALHEIVQLSSALRHGGPDPMDPQGLSDALERAVELASDALAGAGPTNG